MSETMGLPIPPGPTHHVFVRVKGALDAAGLFPGAEVTACSHYDLEGALLTEALVSGRQGEARVRWMLPADAYVKEVRRHDWVREAILEAAGRSDRSVTTAGMLAVYALRADEDDLHLVEHPHALSATAVLKHIAKCLDTADL